MRANGQLCFWEKVTKYQQNTDHISKYTLLSNGFYNKSYCVEPAAGKHDGYSGMQDEMRRP